MNKYYLHLGKKKEKHAGNKAINDCEKIMRDMGLAQIDVYSVTENKFLRFLKWNKFIFILNNLPLNSLIVIDYPMYIHPNYLKYLKRAKKKRNLKLVFIIHDLESLRNMIKNSDFYANRDKIMYSIADIIISHNIYMTKYLVKTMQVKKQKIINLDIFDYLSNIRSLNKKAKNNNLLIAGNLSPQKSGYIYKLQKYLNSNVQLNLYGGGYNIKEKTKNVNYFGVFDPDILPQKIEGKFGIVWDGPSCKSCIGFSGNYLRYNNPHKMSLYIAAGIPIIIWDKAAQAKFVKDNKIGIVVNSLTNIVEVINNLSDSEYQTYKENIIPLQKKIRNGWFLKQALNEAYDKIENN